MSAIDVMSSSGSNGVTDVEDGVGVNLRIRPVQDAGDAKPGNDRDDPEVIKVIEFRDRRRTESSSNKGQMPAIPHTNNRVEERGSALPAVIIILDIIISALLWPLKRDNRHNTTHAPARIEKPIRRLRIPTPTGSCP
jgi:hypothetical protein